MQPIKDYDDYLTRRGQFLSAIDAASRDVSRLMAEVPNERDQAAIKLASDTGQHARAMLVQLDATWEAIVEQQRVATSEETLPDREAQFARVEKDMAARARALRKVASALTKQIKSAVAEYESETAAVLKEVRALGSKVNQRDLSEILRGREREHKVIRALAFEAGLWGIGSQQDAFDYRNFDLDKLIALHTRDILEAVRRALFGDD